MLVVSYNAENGAVGSDHLPSSQYKVDDTGSGEAVPHSHALTFTVERKTC